MNTLATMRQETSVKPVRAAIERNRAAIGRIVNTAAYYELATFPAMQMAEVVRFPRAESMHLTHLLPVAFAVGGDAPERNHPRNRPVELYPRLSMRLQDGVTAASGIIARIDFADLMLPEEAFQNGAPDISALLEPTTFDVALGEHFSQENQTFGGERELTIGGHYDKGELAILTAIAINETVALLGSYSQEELMQLASCQNPLE
ncbi:MAG TPA: hypothetical protein VLG47_02775 [Candidatus Saccharimonadales bacterium]|nr:hypothetical protein [Candidatus Saccharimonadales bacterium]